MKIVTANIVSCFNGERTIGTKVTDSKLFFGYLEYAVDNFDFDAQRIPGQGFIELPSEAIDTVSAGVGKHTNKPEDYVLRRHWTGKVMMFLRRDLAASCTGVAAVVDTLRAYLADPDVVNDPVEAERVKGMGATHVLVTVLAFAGPKPPLPVSTFVRNLAGANNEALAWTADEIRAKAREVQAYSDEWCTVAD